jgi:hypothetical protein
MSVLKQCTTFRKPPLGAGGPPEFIYWGEWVSWTWKKNLQLLLDIREPAEMFQQARESILATGESLPTFQ